MSDQQRQPTLTFRAVLIGLASLLALGMWIQFHEVLLPVNAPIGENSPPTAAVGIILGVLMIGALVTWLRPKLRLRRAELAVIYAMLVTAAPLMSQGMWHRFLGLAAGIPHHRHNLKLVDSYSEKLWPHGPHLLTNRRFEDGLDEATTAEPPERVQLIEVEDSPVGAVHAAEMVNPPDSAAGDEPLETRLHRRIERFQNGEEVLVPGERYYFIYLARLRDVQSQSRLTVELVSDGGERVRLDTLLRETQVDWTSAGGFHRRGQPYVDLPRDVQEYVELVFTFQGPGRAAITDTVWFSNEPLARLHKGSSEVPAGQLERLPDDARDALVVRPDDLASPGGIWYTLKGYIPYRAWLRPAFYWGSLVMAIFVCMLAIAVIFRRQWADNERFTFPLVVLPRLLLEEKELEDGRIVRPLYHRPAFRVGLIVALVYVILMGLGHYVPGMPDVQVNVNLTQYVSSPGLKAAIKGMGGPSFRIILTFVAIAFFIDLEMLASILIFFVLTKIPWYLGEAFGWKNIQGTPDYYQFKFPFPHEQHIGAFLGLALIVLWISRKHLRGVWRTIWGRPDGVDDRGEAMRYRTAGVTIVACFLFFALWGAMTGLGWGSSLLFFAFMVICGLSAARIRTEAGLPWTYFTPYYPYLIFFLLGGLPVFGTRTMVLAFCLGGFMAVAQFLMFAPTQVEMLHLGNELDARPQGIKWGLIIGGLAGVFVGGYVLLVWYYGKGGENLPFTYPLPQAQDFYIGTLRTAVAEADRMTVAAGAQGVEVSPTTSAPALAAVGVGTGITVLLVVLRTHFVGFWLHPIGYILANTYLVHAAWGSILVAWVIKYCGLKFGGPRFVREQLTPCFAGVFCGAVLGTVLWDIVALIAMANGIRDVFCCWA